MREHDLLEHIYAANKSLPDHVTIPPGDDMGAIRYGGRDLMVTVDQVADGVHVNVANTPLELVGRKAITRNLSDVAAMAGGPVCAVVAAALPRGFGQERADALSDALRATGERYGCPLIGGDVTVWDHPLMLTVTVLAEPHATRGPVLRSGAQAGDGIYVTGELGGAWDADGGGPHLTFEPRIELAQTLASRLGADLHAMIDLSDGLATDLAHICRASGVVAGVDPSEVPTRGPARTQWQRAFTDGEDYELCFTAAHDAPVPAVIDGVPITRIGTMQQPHAGLTFGPVFALRTHMPPMPLDLSGWEHRA